MRKIILTLVLSVAVMCASGQTYIKSNALYIATLIPNAGVETRIGRSMTFNGEVVGSLWSSVNQRPLMVLQVIGGVRYYTRSAFRGFYVGGDVGYDSYRMSKWDHPKSDIQHGIGLYLGATMGYQMPIGQRWNIDLYVGGGWHLGHYWGENLLTGQPYVLWNGSGEWIPYKVGVSFAYRLGK